MRIIGLTFCSPKTLELIKSLAPSPVALATFTGDVKAFKEWARKLEPKVTPIALLEDRAQFKALRSAGISHVVAFADFPWLTKRGIVCLDAEAETTDDEKHLITVKRTTPADIWNRLLLKGVQVLPHKTSDQDRWLSRSTTEGLCAGCNRLGDCGSKPTSKRECDDHYKYEKDDSEKTAYKRYSLGQLLHTSLARCDEKLLVATPKEIWFGTYRYALGEVTKAAWIANYGRPMKTAGAAKPGLKRIVRWVDKFGEALQAGKIGDPPSKGDVQFALKVKGSSK